jgi:hypothetical protein
MEILSFGIDRAPRGKKYPGYAVGFAINLQSPTFHDREHFATIVNSAPRGAQTVHHPVETCSRCRGIRVHDPVETLFTIAWNTQCDRIWGMLRVRL